MIIEGIYFPLDLHNELTDLGLKKLKPTTDNIQASCPHKDHQDNHQSFGVLKKDGRCNCFTCGFGGSFLDLVSYLLDITKIEAFRYLYKKYLAGGSYDEDKERKLPDFLISAKVEKRSMFLEESVLDKYKLAGHCFFIQERNITYEYQQIFEIGYDSQNYSLIFPWRDYRGRLVLLKHKDALSKNYLYDNTSKKRDHLYGIHLIHPQKKKEVFLVEGEFDCIYANQLGMPTVAIGSNRIHHNQVKLLYKIGIRKVTLMLDNDKWGEFGAEKAKEILRGFELFKAIYPEGRKDINEMSPEEVAKMKFRRLF